MKVEKNIVKMLEGMGRTELVELASLFLPSPPIRVWEEEFEGEECDDDCEEEEWEDEEK
jgi:hypothetical protein